MLYSDGIHLIHTDGLEALHEAAAQLSIKHCWFHSGSNHIHYDIPKRRRNERLPNVVYVTSKELVAIYRSTQ